MTIPALGPDAALILVDVQNDFCPGGALPVAEGDRVVPVLNRWIDAAVRGGAVIVASRDWHPPNHISFAERGGPWPAHCVQNTTGAELHSDLHVPESAILVDKAADPDRESYSAFDGTQLAEQLRQRGVTTAWVGGLALDVCVRATVLDALREGFRVHVIRKGTRPVDPAGGEQALREMQAAGAIIEMEPALSGTADETQPLRPPLPLGEGRGEGESNREDPLPLSAAEGTSHARSANDGDPLHSILFTDLYELTMCQAYQAEHMNEVAVFELFFRKLPKTRNFVVAAGLNDVLDALEHLHVTQDDLDYLRRQQMFSEEFLGWLASFRFMGDVYAVPEGTIVFPNEPMMQVIAPIAQAQLVETLVLNQIHLQSVMASKAARVIFAAAGRQVVEFGSRRAHGSDAALKVARVSYFVGAVGTSNVLAGQRYGIPVFGTMAHSFIQAHENEESAFEAFSREFPNSTLLVDTYDTLEGVRKIIELSRRLGERFSVGAVRLDSGDLPYLARETRRLLDEGGLPHVRIFVSGGLDEYSVAALLAAGAPIDGFGVGTKQAVSKDATDLDMVFKLVEYAGRPRTKLSAEKVLHPGRKQVFRTLENGRLKADIIGRFDEHLPGSPLLVPVMHNGIRLPAGRVTLEEARAYTQRQLAQLPDDLKGFTAADPPYRVEFSDRLERDLNTLRA